MAKHKVFKHDTALWSTDKERNVGSKVQLYLYNCNFTCQSGIIHQQTWQSIVLLVTDCLHSFLYLYIKTGHHMKRLYLPVRLHTSIHIIQIIVVTHCPHSPLNINIIIPHLPSVIIRHLLQNQNGDLMRNIIISHAVLNLGSNNNI